MKLYTEEQVRQAIAYARSVNATTYENPTIERVLNSFTPIELPNFDKLWDEFRIEHPNTVGGFKEQYECFTWMKEQILNQIK